MKSPKISIIMSTYNDGLYIKQSIESVICQSFSDWEFIIINDASNDDTEKNIKNFTSIDKRIKLFTNTKNKGLVKNLINATQKARGKYIARIDGDDTWIDRNKLQK